MGYQEMYRAASMHETPDHSRLLRALEGYWHSNLADNDYTMLWGAACICFFSFMRAGELVAPSDSSFDPSYHLAFADVLLNSQDSPSYIVVRINASKMDPFRWGAQLYLGRTGNKLCLVAAIFTYMVNRGVGMAHFSDLLMGDFLPKIDS